MAGALFGLELEGVISRISPVRNRRESCELACPWLAGDRVAEGRQRWIKNRLRRWNLIQIAKHLEVCALGSHVRRANQNLTGQLIFKIHVPLVINRGFGIKVLTGHAGKCRIVGIYKTCESRRQVNWRGSYPVAIECRLEEKWQVVINLQRIAGANFVERKEATVSRANY